MFFLTLEVAAEVWLTTYVDSIWKKVDSRLSCKNVINSDFGIVFFWSATIAFAYITFVKKELISLEFNKYKYLPIFKSLHNETGGENFNFRYYVMESQNGLFVAFWFFLYYMRWPLISSIYGSFCKIFLFAVKTKN